MKLTSALLLIVVALSGAAQVSRATDLQKEHFRARVTCDPELHKASVDFSGDPAAIAVRDNPTIIPNPFQARAGTQSQVIASCAIADSLVLDFAADDNSLSYKILLNNIEAIRSTIDDHNELIFTLIDNHFLNVHKCENFIESAGYISNKNGAYEDITKPIFLESFCQSYTVYDTQDPDPPSADQLREYRRGGAESASFNCDYISSQIEKAICSSRVLTWMDRAMAGQVWRLNMLIGNQEPFTQDQRKWLASRNKLCGISKKTTDQPLLDQSEEMNIECLKKIYLDRMQILGDRHFKLREKTPVNSLPTAE